MFKRTPGVSTTDIIGKLLTLVRDNNSSPDVKRKGSFDKPMTTHEYTESIRKAEADLYRERSNSSNTKLREAKSLFANALAGEEVVHKESPHVGLSQTNFLATTRRIMSFQSRSEPAHGDKIVYLHGSFDCMHNGHINLIKKAKEQGDFLYVGVWEDELVSKFCGRNYPILSLHERVLMVMANRYVDDVVIGAPF